MKRTQHIAYFKVPYKQKDNDNYQNNDNFCCGDKKSSKGDGVTDNEDPELNQFYYHSDHLGSSSYITNLNGSIVQHVEYVPFGEVFLEERNNKWNTPYLFNGKELDEETGLYYYGARYYKPRNSIFLSVDPLWEAKPSFSPYAYTMNNPLKFTDPTGMLEEDQPFSYLKPGQQNSEIKTIPNPILQNSYISKLPNSSTNETEIKTLGNPPKGVKGSKEINQVDMIDAWDNTWNWIKNHFYIGAEGEITYGIQLSGILYKGAGFDIDFVSQVVSEGKISNRENYVNYYPIVPSTYMDKGKSCSFGVAYNVGGNYNWNIKNGKNISSTASLGIYGFGGNMTWNNTGVTNLFIGFELSGKIAVGWGVGGSVKIGFTWDR